MFPLWIISSFAVLIITIFLYLLERFSNDCRKTKTKAITPTNHNWSKQCDEPIRIPTNYIYLIKITLTSCDRSCLTSESLRSKNALFALFSLVFSPKKKIALSPQSWCEWITHLKKKTSWLFLITWKSKTHICKSRRAVDNNFRTCVTCHGQLRMRTMTKQTNS